MIELEQSPGDLEGALRYLASLGEATVVEDDAEGSDAA
jgi:hypothetical protein